MNTTKQTEKTSFECLGNKLWMNKLSGWYDDVQSEDIKQNGGFFLLEDEMEFIEENIQFEDEEDVLLGGVYRILEEQHHYKLEQDYLILEAEG
ncbi:MAG: hypothetical protein ACYCUI_14535 [Vulcanimicrobiaceae bacterium]